MRKLQQLYEGKAKKVYATEDERAVIVSYKDDATAFNGLKKGTIAGKGVINNQMSNLLMIIIKFVKISVLKLKMVIGLLYAEKTVAENQVF